VKETLGRVRSDTDVHRALGLGCDPSDRECVISESTFYDFRDKFPEVDGPRRAALLTTKHFCQMYCVEVKVVRYDSTYVMSNIRDLNTGGALFRECLFCSVRELLRAFPGAERELAPEIRNRYDRSGKIGYDPFAQACRRDKPGILRRMAGDVEAIVRQFRFDPRVYGQIWFGILKRLLREQCSAVPGPDGGGPTVMLRDSRDIAADSLRSPYDTGATCSGHKKKGRKVQLAESCGETEKNRLEPSLNLLLHVSTGGAHVSDVHAVEPLIACLEMTGVRAELILVDNAYNTPHNRGLAGEYGADMVTSVNGGLKDPSGTGGGAAGEPGYSAADFATDGNGVVTGSQGRKPASATVSRGGDAVNVHFDRAVCADCECRGRCPAAIGKRSACGMRYGPASLEAVRNRAVNGRPENVAKARQRNGVEGTVSEWKRGPGAGRLRVRGDRRVKAAVFLKMAGVNLMRINGFRLDCERIRRRI
jgi:hypothetical protein